MGWYPILNSVVLIVLCLIVLGTYIRHVASNREQYNRAENKLDSIGAGVVLMRKDLERVLGGLGAERSERQLAALASAVGNEPEKVMAQLDRIEANVVLIGKDFGIHKRGLVPVDGLDPEPGGDEEA